MYKEYNNIIYKLDDGVWLPYLEQKPNKNKSFITLFQLEWYFPEFITHLANIIFVSKVERDKNFARSVLQYLSLNQYVSQRQFDSILKVKYE